LLASGAAEKPADVLPPGFHATLRTSFLRFQEIPIYALKPPIEFREMRLNEDPVTVGGELYVGFRFTVPEGHGDLIWAFVIPPNVRSWYILCAREDSGDGFDSFNTKSVSRLIVPARTA